MIYPKIQQPPPNKTPTFLEAPFTSLDLHLEPATRGQNIGPGEVQTWSRPGKQRASPVAWSHLHIHRCHRCHRSSKVILVKSIENQRIPTNLPQSICKFRTSSCPLQKFVLKVECLGTDINATAHSRAETMVVHKRTSKPFGRQILECLQSSYN